MKPQDAIFLIIFVFLIFKRSFKLTLSLGLACLILAIPLFSSWIFFTAQRLIYYAASFIALAIIFIFIEELKNESKG